MKPPGSISEVEKILNLMMMWSIEYTCVKYNLNTIYTKHWCKWYLIEHKKEKCREILK